MSSNFKIIIPMAGWGSRMRPLTWRRPKPLLALAGRTVLDYSLHQFDTLPGIEQAEYVFIISPNQGDQIQKFMHAVHPAKKVHFVVQEEMRGQAQALWCAREFMQGPVLIAFSDTLIETNLAFLAGEPMDAVAWVKPMEDPRRFGVIETDNNGLATRLVEKPQDFSNNLVVVGFYYFKEAERLLEAIVEQMQRGTSLKGEYFLADALNLMLESGAKLRSQTVDVWLDCGKPERTARTPPSSMTPMIDTRKRPNQIRKNCTISVKIAESKPLIVTYMATVAAEIHMLTSQFHPRNVWSTSAIAYRLMPETSSVITANAIPLSTRVFSSKRSFRYPGTELIFDEK